MKITAGHPHRAAGEVLGIEFLGEADRHRFAGEGADFIEVRRIRLAIEEQDHTAATAQESDERAGLFVVEQGQA